MKEAAIWERIDALKPWKDNPRKNKGAINHVAESIRRFGFASPIIARSDDKVIIAGHTRFEAAKKLGLDSVPVRYLDLDPADSRLLALADNKIGEIAEWDEEKLEKVMQELLEEGLSLDGIGWSDDELNKIVDELKQEEIEEDEVPEADEEGEPDSKLGEVYELGEHRLICGDSTDINDVKKLMDGQLADMLFTDPPYGVSYEGGHNQKKRAQIKNDALQGKDLTNLFADSLTSAIAVTAEHAAFYIWFASGKSIETFASFANLPLELRAVIQWYKVRSGLGAFMSQYIPNCEPCIYAFKTGCSPQWFGPSDEKTVWELQRESTNDYHPTQKPVGLAARAIKNSSLHEQIILDLFGGSGSTLIAAAQTKRRARLVELDPKYCDVIRRRWTQYAKDHDLEVGTGGLE